MVSENLVCLICHLNEHKYTCPACGVKTCSINCVKRHKRQTECSGLVDQSKFVPKKILSQDESHINRDYNFLMNVGRQIHVGKGDIKSSAKNVFKRQFGGGNQNKNKRFKGNNVDSQEAVDTRIECVKKAFLQEPTTVIKRNNTMIIQLPPGMSRATSNKTGYDKKVGSFIWTVEWVVIDDAGNEKDRFISYRLKEHLLLRDAVPMNILSNAVSVNGEGDSARNIDKEQLHFYLANVVGNDNTKDSILHLNEADLISDALTNKIVLEYPTIYITFNAETWKNRIIKEEDAYNYAKPESLSESGSSDDSDSDDSSDSDSDSDSESDSDEKNTDNETDSDEAPEESSSKPLKVTFDAEAPTQNAPEANKSEE